MISIVVLISGSGTNLTALLAAASKPTASFRITCVISNNSEAHGLERAREHEILTRVIERQHYATLQAHKEAVLEEVLSQKPHLVVLAGFMMVLHDRFVHSFPGRIINIHPSLLPLYPGLHTHERALADNRKTHGCTVHFVDSGVDTGAVIAQAEVVIPEGSTPESLRTLVQEREWRLYPWVVESIAKREIALVNGCVSYSPVALVEASTLGFILST